MDKETPFPLHTCLIRYLLQQVFSGAAGLTYGAENVMQIYIPGLYDSAGTGPAIAWYDDIHLPGSSQMQYIQRLLTSSPWYPDLVPDASVIIGDPGRDDNRTLAMRSTGTSNSADGGGCILVYTPTGASFGLQMQGLMGLGGNMSARWYDPLNGEGTAFPIPAPSASGSGNNGTVVMFEPPVSAEHKDWALVLEVQP